MTPPTEQALGSAAALACAATWAVATLLFGRAAQTVDARALNLWKCALSAALLGLAALAVDDVPVLSARDSVALAVSALLGLVLADTCYFVALKHLGAARGVLFVSLVPVATALLAVPVLDEPLTPRMALGMALTLAGVTVVVRTRVTGDAGRGRVALGVAAGVVYSLAQAGANVLTKGADAALSPLALSVVRMAIGALVLGALLGATARGRAHVVALRPVLRSTTIATIVGTFLGLLLGTYALRTVSAGAATTLIATTPLFALVLARAVTGETPPPRALAGAVLALVGVAVLVT